MSFREISRIVVDQIDVIDHDFPGTLHIHTTSPKYFQPKVLFKYFFRFISLILLIKKWQDDVVFLGFFLIQLVQITEKRIFLIIKNDNYF